jgi:hypothetical protein
MKRLLILSIVIMAMAAVTATAGDTETYGEGVTLDDVVAIDALVANPDDYVGKKVRVDGVITGVCQKRGCWMQLTDPESGNGVRIKVEDGAIVFPPTAMGREATAEGVFEAIKLTPEQTAARTASERDSTEGEDGSTGGPMAEGAGAGCDTPAVDEYVYLIRGTGAVIKG